MYMSALHIKVYDIEAGSSESVADGYEPYMSESGGRMWREGTSKLMYQPSDDPNNANIEVWRDNCTVCQFPTLSPNGEYVAWSGQLPDSTYGTAVAEFQSGSIIASFTGFTDRAAWTSSGALVIGGDALYRIEIPDDEPQLLTDAFPGAASPVVDSATERIAFHYENEIWTSALDGSDAVQVTTSGEGSRWAFFSPDGASLVVTHGQTNEPPLVVVDAHPAEPIDLDEAGTGVELVELAENAGISADGPFTWR